MPGYDIFLSYSRADAAAADRLRTRLDQDAGLKAFLDRYALPGGKPWQPELEAALAACRALVVLLGPAGIGGWQHREIQLGLDRQTAAARTATPFPVIPVLLPGLQPDDVPLGTFLALNTWVDLRPGLDEPEPLQRLIAAAQGRAIDGLTRDLAGLRPYRGLLPFREQDAGLFFGRQRFVDELVAKVRQQRSATNLVAVLGRSGSGKSSVVFAGLFSALRQEKGVGQQAVWNIASLRPGKQPLQALIETFDPPDPRLGETETLAALNRRADLPRKGEVTLAQLVTRRIEKDQGTTREPLYVDQWEELYTQAQPREAKTDEDKARAADARLFVDLVLDAAAKAPCTLVLSARSDFYPDIQTHDRLRAAVQDCQVSLGPMSKAELTAVIEGPAKAVGGSVERELRTRKLLRDIGLAAAPGGQDQYDIGKLPLLEYALEQAWAKADDGTIGLGQYAGLEQALEERANKVFDQLPPDQQAAAKRLFVSLVTPGEGREDTRARFTLPDNPVMLAVAETFAGAGARLIVTGDDSTGTRLAEVSHEALIRHWEKLRIWVDENRSNLKTRAELVADRTKWLSTGKDRTLLIGPGLRLEAARCLRDQPGDVVVDDIADYLDASFAADARRKVWRTVAFTSVAATAVLMTGLAGFGWYQFTQAERRADGITAALIWSRLDFERTEDPRSAASVEALWDLATGTTAIRDGFLRLLPQDRHQLGTLTAAPISIARAFGLRPDAQDIQRLFDPVLEAIRRTSDPQRLRALAQAVQILGPKLDPEHAQAALGLALHAISQATEPFRLLALALAVRTFDPTPEQAQAAIGPVIDAVYKTPANRFQLLALAQAVHTLNPTPEQAKAALLPVLSAIRRTTDPFQLQALAQAVHTLGPTPEQAHAALGPVLDAVHQTTEPDSLDALAHAVQALGPKLGSEQARAALGRIVDAIRQTTSPPALRVLAQAVQALGPELAPEQAQAALGPVLDAIRRIDTVNPYQLQALAQAVQTLGPISEQAHAALGAVHQPTDADYLEALAQAVQTLGPSLALRGAQEAFDIVFLDIEETTDSDQLRTLAAQAVQTLGPILELDVTQYDVEIAEAVLATTDEPPVAEAFASAIAVLLPAEPPQAYVAAVVKLLKWPTTAGRATDTLLDALRERVPGAPGKEAGLDATVEWVAATYPEIDLDSPPTHPTSAGTGSAP